MKNDTSTCNNPRPLNFTMNIDLTNLDIETLEAFFPSEHPSEATASENDPEARRKAFFQSCRRAEVRQ